MKLVLLSGGSGKRLWPLSNDTRSKQFLKIMPDGEHDRISMVQRTWKQLSSLGLTDDTYICTSASQVESILHHLGQVNVITEPVRRDTFPAIALASLYFDQIENGSADGSGARTGPAEEDDVVVVIPVDHFVDDEFFRAVANLPAALARSGADLALLGVCPKEPSPQYGYMRVGERLSDDLEVFRVESFVEKPGIPAARELIRQGALWNCGVFCFRRSFIRSFLRRRGYPDHYVDFLSQFSQLPKRSFDHEVVEHTAFIAVRPFSGMWTDIGTWGTLVDRLDITTMGSAAQVDCEGCSVISELHVPVIAKGLKDVLVAASPDGILVASKSICGDIKDVVNEHAVRPMHEERHFGTSTVMQHFHADEGVEVVVNSVYVRAGHAISYHRHALRDEYWTILDGRGRVVLGDESRTVGSGAIIHIPKGQWHSLRAVTDLKMVEAQRGIEVIESDIERREDARPAPLRDNVIQSMSL